MSLSVEIPPDSPYVRSDVANNNAMSRRERVRMMQVTEFPFGVAATEYPSRVQDYLQQEKPKQEKTQANVPSSEHKTSVVIAVQTTMIHI